MPPKKAIAAAEKAGTDKATNKISDEDVILEVARMQTSWHLLQPTDISSVPYQAEQTVQCH